MLKIWSWLYQLYHSYSLTPTTASIFVIITLYSQLLSDKYLLFLDIILDVSIKVSVHYHSLLNQYCSARLVCILEYLAYLPPLGDFILFFQVSFGNKSLLGVSYRQQTQVSSGACKLHQLHGLHPVALTVTIAFSIQDTKQMKEKREEEQICL